MKIKTKPHELQQGKTMLLFYKNHKKSLYYTSDKQITLFDLLYEDSVLT